MDEYAFKSFLNNIIFNLTTLIENMGYESNGLVEAKYSYITLIDGALNVQDALNQWVKFLNEAKKIIEVDESSRIHPNMQRLLNYIDNNYSQPLNLTELGKYFHYNPSYLSNYFSTHYNQGFNEYLNQVRIKKAIQLLES